MISGQAPGRPAFSPPNGPLIGLLLLFLSRISDSSPPPLSRSPVSPIFRSSQTHKAVPRDKRKQISQNRSQYTCDPTLRLADFPLRLCFPRHTLVITGPRPQLGNQLPTCDMAFPFPILSMSHTLYLEAAPEPSQSTGARCSPLPNYALPGVCTCGVAGARLRAHQNRAWASIRV
jgi:hypothetical protein